jgi:hypothetical protein
MYECNANVEDEGSTKMQILHMANVERQDLDYGVSATKRLAK